MRRALRQLDNGHDVVVVTYCSWEAYLSNGEPATFRGSNDTDCTAAPGDGWNTTESMSTPVTGCEKWAANLTMLLALGWPDRTAKATRGALCTTLTGLPLRLPAAFGG